MSGSTKGAERLRTVLDALAKTSWNLSLEGLPDRILRQAGEMVDAERGYLDIIDLRIGAFAAYGIASLGDGERPSRQLLVDLLDQPNPGSEPGAVTRADRLAFIGIPIRFHDHVFAHLYLADHTSGCGFSREDEEIATAFASAAGVVIENARLYEEGERQRMWLEAAAGITSALLSPISRSTGLQLVADRARDVAAADFVALLMPIDQRTLVVEAVSGVPAEGVLGEHIDACRSVAGEAARLRETIVVPNTDLEPRYQPQKTPAWPGLSSLMVLPLRSEEETGALIVGWFTGHTGQRQLDTDLPQRFADQAALVLQVARAQEDQARLAVFVDRARIGRDLHDLVIQRLFGIGLVLDNTTKLISSTAATDRLSTVIDDIDQTIKDIRRTIFALGSAADSSDLRAEIEQIMLHSAGLLGFNPELRLSGPVDSVIVDGIRAHLVAVLGELMSNIVRHSKAGRVVVEITALADITLVVRDDRSGFESPQAGSGLRNIRERAALLAGHCTVDSNPGEGTAITWTVPRSVV